MLQVKFLLVGLLLAALFVGYQWLDQLPDIPPVRLPESAAVEPAGDPGVVETQQESGAGLVSEGSGGLTPPVTPPPEPLPGLNESDNWLRERLTAYALPWLAETELVRTSATVLDNAARGDVPRKFLDFLAPKGRFSVAADDGRLVPDAASYARYDGFAETLLSLPPERAAALFVRIEPLLAEALRELGGDATGYVASPRELANGALGVALATPGDVSDKTLVRPKVIYKYADQDLEKLLPLQKQLLRMGPDNLQKVRTWLEAFAAALATGLSTGSAESGDV